MRAIGLIIISKNFDEIKQLLKCIFTVSMNEKDRLDMNEEPMSCENGKNHLKLSIANNLVIMNLQDFNNFSDINDEILDSKNIILEKNLSTNVFDTIKKKLWYMFSRTVWILKIII